MDSDLQMTLETVLRAPEIRLCYVILRQRLLGICGVTTELQPPSSAGASG